MAPQPPPFATTLKSHLHTWALESGLGPHLETGRPLSWVLTKEARRRNLFRPGWWRHIEGFEHRWARALNSSQCFAVNLFAPLADDPRLANVFLRKMLPARDFGEGDAVSVAFEHSPAGVAQRLGERGQPTQIDVFFTVTRPSGERGAIGVEVKLTESEFGGCRGWSGKEGGVPINSARERCLDGAAVLGAPEAACFMAEREGRTYWSEMLRPGASFVHEGLAAQTHCPFRHGLYQMMRNRVTLDAMQAMDGLAFCDFVACLHPENQEARRLPDPVSGRSDALEAFHSLVRPGALLEWDARAVLEAIANLGDAPVGWADWMRGKYLLGPPASAD